ncbi:uncharacterized protein PRCAT00002944001 [Priceomyces carsonii]|uniref:uncharacterized protein n=1 Tax=Priceomyces carsonii TaxID=28549 RepID=UPI002ED8886B|nr:unnamed protein product [Priceomyces carsonii]
MLALSIYKSQVRCHKYIFKKSCCISFSRTFLGFPSPFHNNAPNLQSKKISKRVNASPKEMFDIVSDVSRYHEFVPFVEKSIIHSRDPKTKQPTVAELRIGWKEYDESFTCKLNCIPNKKVVAESLTLALFEQLQTVWEFSEVKTLSGVACNVDLALNFSFKNPIYTAISSLFSDQVSQIMIKAFENRVKELKSGRQLS